MKVIKRIFSVSVLTSLVFLIFGLLLVFRTEGTIHLISSAIGLVLLINGGSSVIRYFREDKNTINMIYGMVAILAGFVLILNPTTIVSILPFVLGVYFTISGFIKFKYALDIKKYQRKMPVLMSIMSVLMIVCGILFIVNPFEGAVAITKIIGVYLVIYSTLDIVNCFILRKSVDIIVRESRW